jgi:hypothetical protein
MWLKIIFQSLPYVFKLLDWLFAYIEKRNDIKRKRELDLEKEKKNIISDEDATANNERLKHVRDNLNWWIKDFKKASLELKKQEALRKGNTKKADKFASKISSLFDETNDSKPS